MAHSPRPRAVVVLILYICMIDSTKEGLKQLKKIEGQLDDLNDATWSWSGWFVRGLWQGAGIVVGTIVAVVLLGWLLSLLGIVPGFSEIADYIGRATERVRGF